MQLFIDSANPACWKSVCDTGLFSGVTTNPLLIQRAGLPVSIETCTRLYDDAMALGFQMIHFQVWGSQWLQIAEQIAQLGPETVIKIPANHLGFQVASGLGLPGRTTLTAVYSVGQVIAAEALGVAYTAPYYARLKEAGEPADLMFDQMLGVTSNTRLLVASLRSVEQVIALAARRFSTFALPEPLLRDLFYSAQAEAAIDAFEQAAVRSQTPA